MRDFSDSSSLKRDLCTRKQFSYREYNIHQILVPLMLLNVLSLLLWLVMKIASETWYCVMRRYLMCCRKSLICKALYTSRCLSSLRVSVFNRQEGYVLSWTVSKLRNGRLSEIVESSLRDTEISSGSCIYTLRYDHLMNILRPLDE